MCQATAGKITRITKWFNDRPDSGIVQYMGPDGIEQEVSLAFVPEVKAGDYVLVHVGLPLHIVTREEALEKEEWRRTITRQIALDRGNETNYLRSEEPIQLLVAEIRRLASREYTIMEVCGAHTEVINLYKLQDLLEGYVRFVPGPGCPVCVTTGNYIDVCIDLACREGVVVAAFGDIMHTPGSFGMSLARAISERGAKVEEVDSPDGALFYALKHPDLQVVYFAIGFETTSAPNARTLYEVVTKKVSNFTMVVTQVMVPPALRMLFSTEGFHVDGVLLAGHVCAVMGTHEYPSIAQQYHVPMVVTGFEPVDFLLGVSMCVRMLEEQRSGVENAYLRMVTEKGNLEAQRLIEQMFYHEDCEWNGFGMIPKSGLRIRPEYRAFDAMHRFGITLGPSVRDPRCKLADIYLNKCTPADCPEFGRTCTPTRQVGPGMGGEGPCKSAFATQVLQKEAL